MESPSRINLRDSNPIRGDMFIEMGTIKHIQLRQERYVRSLSGTRIAPTELGGLVGCVTL